MGDDIHTIAEIDSRKLPPDHAPGTQGKPAVSTSNAPRGPLLAPPEPKVAPFPDAERRRLETQSITIDLMLLYTKNATNYHIGRPDDLLALTVEETNETFRTSGLGNISVRLVHSQLTDYDEADGLHIDHLYGMVDGVGVFKDLTKLRNEKRAEIRIAGQTMPGSNNFSPPPASSVGWLDPVKNPSCNRALRGI
jgi:hypothetical protein